MIEKPEKTSKSRTLELKIYNKIGVLIFRQFILKYEAFRHRKDGLKNKNYHIENYTPESVDRFVGYLVYNSVLHIISILFTVLYFVVKWCAVPKWNIMDVVMCFITIFNIYCIMLQRYNYLRMHTLSTQHHIYQEKQIMKQVETILEKFPTDYTLDQMKMDAKVLADMRESIVGARDYFVTEDQIESFNRMAGLMNEVRKNPVIKQVECDYGEKPYSKIEQRVDRLQKWLRWDESKRILSSYSVITVDSDCEKAFNRLFMKDSKENILKKIKILEEVFYMKIAGQCE